MKKDVIRKILSLSLALAMSAAALPVFADENDTAAEAETTAEETVEVTEEEAAEETEGEEPSEDAYEEVTEDVAEEVREMTEKEKKTLSRLNLLQNLGVMTDYTADDVLENGSVTRAEFVDIIIDMYNGKATGGTLDYNDVSSSDDFAESLGILTTLGVIHGDENGNFNPENAIKGVEMIKTAVAMLGYDVFAEYRGGYYTGYLNIASERGLSKGINLSGDAELNDIIEVLYRILDSETVGFYLNGSLEMLDETFMEHWFDMFEADGYVSANEYSGVIGVNAAAKDTVVIGGTAYTDADDIVTDYLGYNVDFWYIDNNDDDPYVVWAEPDNKVTTVTFSSEDLLNATTLSLEYDLNDKSKTIRLSEDVSVIYNGVEYSGFTADFFMGVNGEFIAVSNNKKNVYDTLVVKDYEYYIVDKADAGNFTVKDKFGRILKAKIDDDEEAVIWRDLDGYAYDIASLQELDVLAVQRDINKDTFFKITVFQSWATGDVTGWVDKDGSDYVCIDGTEYKISDHYFDKADDTYPVYSRTFGGVFAVLDLNGNIIMLEITKEEDYKMGVLVKFVNDDAEETMYAKIFESSSDYTTYPVSKKLKVDGRKVTKNNEFVSAIAMLQEGDVIKYTGSTGSLPNDENFVYQFIRYSVNEDGEVNKIDTAAPDMNDPAEQLINVLSVDISSERGKRLSYKSSGSAFNKLITVENANCWHLPTAADYDNVESYKIEKANFSNDSTWEILPYTTSYDTQNAPKVIVMIDQYKVNIGDAWMFESISRVLDDDDDPVTQVVAWKGNTKEILTATDASLFDGLEKGDLFSCTKDAKGETVIVRKMFDLEDEQFYNVGQENVTTLPNPTIGSPLSFARTRYIYADVYNKSGSSFTLASKFNPVKGSDGLYGFDVIPAASVGKKDLLEYHNIDLFTSAKGAVVYNVYEKTIKAATKDDIRSYKSDGSNCSKVVAITNGGESRYLFIYNFEE